MSKIPTQDEFNKISAILATFDHPKIVDNDLCTIWEFNPSEGNTSLGLISLGSGFTGDETRLRMTKENTPQLTIWHSNGKSYTFDWTELIGDSVYCLWKVAFALLGKHLEASR